MALYKLVTQKHSLGTNLCELKLLKKEMRLFSSCFLRASVFQAFVTVSEIESGLFQWNVSSESGIALY